MIQRIQSLYLAVVCIVMVTFLGVAVWMKVSLDHVLIMKPYALITSSGQYIIFPYGLSFLLACYINLVAAYAIIRHDNRNLQLRLISRMNFVLMVLVLLVFVLIKKADKAYLDGLSSYKLGIIFPFIALVANMLARYHIQNDEKLVSEDHLR